MASSCSFLHLDLIGYNATCHAGVMWNGALACCLLLSCFCLRFKNRNSLSGKVNHYIHLWCSEHGHSLIFFKWGKSSWLREGFLLITNAPSRIAGSTFIWQNCSGAATSNSSHLWEGLHVHPQFDSYSPLLWKADNTIYALYSVLLLSCRNAMMWVSLLFLGTLNACSSSYELFKGFVLIVAYLTLSCLCAISLSTGSHTENPFRKIAGPHLILISYR